MPRYIQTLTINLEVFSCFSYSILFEFSLSLSLSHTHTHACIYALSVSYILGNNSGEVFLSVLELVPRSLEPLFNRKILQLPYLFFLFFLSTNSDAI